MRKAIIFDLDGTLWDATGCSVDIWNRVFDKHEEVKYLSEHGAVLYDGIEETLSSLEKDYDLYIVSNCQDGYVPAFLHAHKMEHHFKDIEMSGRTGMDKGENIKLLMERNEIENAVYVGDTEGDENAARYAGIQFIWASYGFGQAKSPDKVIGSIKELKNSF